MRMFTGKEYVNKAFSIPISTRMGTYNESTAQKEAVATAFRNQYLLLHIMDCLLKKRMSEKTVL